MSDILKRVHDKHLDRARGMLPGGQGSAEDLGGPVGLPAGGGMPGMQRPQLPMNLGVGYRNQYGTKAYVGFDPTTGTIDAHGAIPIGDARHGLTVDGRAGYDPNQGFSGFLGVSKKNLPQDLQQAGQVLGIDRPGGEKYSLGVSLNDPRYSGSPAFGAGGAMMPSMAPPPGSYGPAPQQPQQQPIYTTLPDADESYYGSSFYRPQQPGSLSSY